MFGVPTAMPSGNDPDMRAPIGKQAARARGQKNHPSRKAAANDVLTDQLRQLYDSIADEPIPASLLALFEQIKP